MKTRLLVRILSTELTNAVEMIERRGREKEVFVRRWRNATMMDDTALVVMAVAVVVRSPPCW